MDPPYSRETLAVMAQTIERIEIELQRLRTGLQTLLALNSGKVPPRTRPIGTQTPRQRSMRCLIETMIAVSGEDWTMQEVRQALAIEGLAPNTKSITQAMSRLSQEGRLARVRRGVYRGSSAS